MIHRLLVPAFGELRELKVLAWHKAPGDVVVDGEILAELETEKAIVEVRAQGTAILRECRCAAGDWHTLGEPLALLSSERDEPLPSVTDALPEMPATFESS